MEQPTLCFAQLEVFGNCAIQNMTWKRSFKSRHDLKEKLESTTFKTHLISALGAEIRTIKLSCVEVDFLAEGASDAVEVLPWKYNLEKGVKQSTFSNPHILNVNSSIVTYCTNCFTCFFAWFKPQLESFLR